VRLAAVMFFVAAAVTLAGCTTYGNDEGVRYLQRKDTVTLSAGDASQVNAVAQTINPWPPAVGNRNIPMEGSRGVRAIECYRQGSGQQLVSDKQGQAPNQQNIASGSGSASAGGTGGANQLNCGQ
jgi:hypothetical protein